MYDLLEISATKRHKRLKSHLSNLAPLCGLSAASLFAHHVGAVLFILTDAFDELAVGIQVEGKSHRPGFRIRLRIIECDLNIHMPEVAAAKALGHAQGIGVGMSGIIEPALIIESDGLGNERVTFPPAYGISKPGLRRFRRKTAAIREHQPETIELFIDDH